MTKKVLSFILALAMIFSIGTTSVFAQDNSAVIAENDALETLSTTNESNTRAVTLPNNAQYINDTGAVGMAADPDTYTYLSLNLPSYTAYLYVELCVYDRGNIDSYYLWEVKRPGRTYWEDLESMCPGDYSSCVEAITAASAGTYQFRVKGNMFASDSSSKEALVCFWK